MPRTPALRTSSAPPAGEPLITLRQAAAHLQVSERTIRRLIASKRLPVVPIGRLKRVRPCDLRALIRSEL